MFVNCNPFKNKIHRHSGGIDEGNFLFWAGKEVDAAQHFRLQGEMECQVGIAKNIRNKTVAEGQAI